MDQPSHMPIEEMEFFKDYVALADWTWSVVSKWPRFAQDTIGKQLVRAIDRVGATLVEGDARFSDAEAAHFFTIARGSARETRYWFQRAVARDLLSADEAERRLDALNRATRQLNVLIRYRRRSASNGRVSEDPTAYVAQTTDPFTDDA